MRIVFTLLICWIALPSAAEEAWQTYLAGTREGPSPFKSYRYADGLLTLKYPAGWKIKIARQGREEQLLIYPPAASPSDPAIAYLLLMVRLPPGKMDQAKLDAGVALVTDKVKDRLIAADLSRRTHTIGKPRDLKFQGRTAREYELAGVAAKQQTRTVLRGTINKQAALTMIQVWPSKATAPYRKLFAYIDSTLAFHSPPATPRGMGKRRVPFIGHGWIMQIPETWTGSAIKFNQSPSYTLGHKRLLVEKDTRAIRMIVTTMTGEKLAAYDAAALAGNVALKLRQSNPGLTIARSDKDWRIDGLPAARLVLRGKMKQSAFDAVTWVLVIKQKTRAFLVLVLAGEQEMEKAGTALEQVLRSFKRVAVERK